MTATRIVNFISYKQFRNINQIRFIIKRNQLYLISQYHSIRKRLGTAIRMWLLDHVAYRRLSYIPFPARCYFRTYVSHSGQPLYSGEHADQLCLYYLCPDAAVLNLLLAVSLDSVSVSSS